MNKHKERSGHRRDIWVAICVVSAVTVRHDHNHRTMLGNQTAVGIWQIGHVLSLFSSSLLYDRYVIPKNEHGLVTPPPLTVIVSSGGER